MSEQEEREIQDEIFQEERVREGLRKLSSEDLEHIDSIVTNIYKLRENKSVDSTLWAMLFMWFLGMPASDVNAVLTSNKEENE